MYRRQKQSNQREKHSDYQRQNRLQIKPLTVFIKPISLVKLSYFQMPMSQ